MRLKDRRKRKNIGQNNKKQWEPQEDKISVPRYKKPSTDRYKKYKNTFVSVSSHCVDRFIEIMPEIEHLERKKIHGMILAMYRDGCIFGGQYGDDFLILSKSRRGREVVFACTTDKNEKAEKIIIIKTTLTVDHANGNLQQKEINNPEVSLVEVEEGDL